MSDYSRRTAATRSTDRRRDPARIPKPKLLTSNGTKTLFDKGSEAMSILGELQQEQYAQHIGGAAPMEMKYQVLLDGLGFSIVKNEELSPGLQNLKDFSLIGSTNVDETIDNKRIVDPDLEKLTPIKTEAFDKFKSATDAFYELDEERSRSIKKIQDKEKVHHKKVVIKVSRDLARISRKSHNKILPKTPRGGLK